MQDLTGRGAHEIESLPMPEWQPRPTPVHARTCSGRTHPRLERCRQDGWCDFFHYRACDAFHVGTYPL